MWPLDIKNMFGIGKKTQPRLREVGIMTIGDIANYNNYNQLRQIIGKNALLLYRRANGIDNRVVDTKQNELKSVGNSITLPHDTLDEIILLDTLKQLARQVSMRATKRNLISNSISITIKYTRFESVNRQTTINSYINDYEYILSTAKMLFDAHYDGRPVRLLGISLNNTINKKNYKEQLNIFNSTNDIEKDEDIQTIIENINNKFEKTIVTKASDISKKNIQKKYLNQIFQWLFNNLDVANTEYGKKLAIRNITIIELLFSTGIRISELCNIRIKDINFQDRSLKIFGKGSKERVLYLGNDQVIQSLEKYIELNKNIDEENNYLFLNKFNTQLSEQTVRILLKNIEKDLNLSIHITPHMFRHTFATTLLEKEVDIRYIQNILGHSSISTTQIYTHVTYPKQKEILIKKNPMNDYKNSDFQSI